MFEHLLGKPQKIVVIGDAFVSPDTMEEAVKKSKLNIGVIIKTFWGENDKQVFTSRQLNVERNGPDAEPYAEGLDDVIKDADILMTHFCPIPRKLINKAENLKLILTCRGGLENICVDAASERNIPIVNVIRNSEPVAEFVLGLILSLTRNIAFSHQKLVSGKWVKEFNNSPFLTTLNQLTVGLAGVGNIGIEVALKLKALGVNVIAHDDYLSKERLEKNGLGDIKLTTSLEELFSKADIISIHLRLTKENLKFIDEKYFSLMKPTAYFINTARGGLVNQEDLVEALKSHSIAGAALDVFDSEPLEETSGFNELDNVVITPHIAGTTVDAIPKSPFMLVKELNKILTNDVTDRIVNYKDINII